MVLTPAASAARTPPSLAMAPPWGSVDDDGEEERSWLDAGVSSVAGAMDHNAQNYVDSIQYLNVRRFTGSSSKAL